jgi:RNA methyltransferase, TrmH family
VVQRFRLARRDRSLVLIEGFHALKHALRFGAHVLEVATADAGRPAALAAQLAPDVADRIAGIPATTITEAALRSVCSAARGEAIIAIARRPPSDAGVAMRATDRPMVFLEEPTSLTNVGAVIRVAAAADAAAVITSGVHDPWHQAAIRGSAGLHFALPVARVHGETWIDACAGSGRPLIAVHPEGDALPADAWPDDAILAFGSERHGLSPYLRRHADARITIPMRAGVSSLSLATAVAVTLYARGHRAAVTPPWPELPGGA